MQKNINIGFPIDLQRLIETRLLVQANSGGGKSYLIRKLAEEVYGKVPFVIIDLEGEFVTLREKFDVVIMGKGHDIPLNIEHAGKIARYLLELRATAVLDLSEMKMPERLLFVKLFIESLMDAPKSLWHPTMIIIDEAHQFCPEGKEKKDGAVSAEAVVDLCTRGRKRGYCAVLATQRISSLRKGAIAQVNNKLIGRTTLDTDVKRTAFELGMSNNDAQRMLPQLDEGEFYVFGSAISKQVEKRKIATVKTTHVTTGMKLGKTSAPSNAVQKIIDKIADIPKEVQQEKDILKNLQDENKRLKQELRTSKVVVQDKGHSPIATIYKGHTAKHWHDQLESDKEDINSLQKQNKQYRASLQNIKTHLKTIEEFAEKGTKKVVELQKFVSDQEREPVKINYTANRISSQQNTHVPKAKPYTIEVKNTNQKPVIAHFGNNRNDNTIPKGEKAVLIACAQFPNGLYRNQITVLTQYKRSSRDAYIQRLKEKGFVASSGDKITITEEGIHNLGDDYQPLPIGDELRQHWLNTLPQGEKVMLELISEAYPNSITREELTEKSNYQRSSRDAYLQRMLAKEIIKIINRGEVIASEQLFG